MRYTDTGFINDLITCIKADEAVTKDQKNHPDQWNNLSYLAMRNRRRDIAADTAGKSFTPARPH